MATIEQLEQELAQVAEEFFRLVDQANALERAGDRGPEFQRLSERIRELRAQRVRINQELSALRAAQKPQSVAADVAASGAPAAQNPAVAPQSVNAAGAVATTPAQTVPTNAEKFNPAAQETTGTNDTLRPAERTQATPATVATPGAPPPTQSDDALPNGATVAVPNTSAGAAAPKDDQTDSSQTNPTRTRINEVFGGPA